MTDALKGARDFLLQHRTDYARAHAEFRWPRLERFNFALDWFDVIARERDSEALRIVADDRPGRDLALFASSPAPPTGWPTCCATPA